MLIRFIVSNFMSFKEETEFNMLPSKGNGSRSLTNHIKKTKSGIEVLKTAAIYGANAAGKSNLIKAISFLKSIVIDEVELLIPQSKRFRLDKEYLEKSTTFRVEYEYKNIHFDFAVEILKGKIIEEWLYVIDSLSKSKEVFLYSRKNNEVVFGDYFTKKDVAFVSKLLKKKLKDTQTVLNACFGNFDDTPILDTILMAFANTHTIYPNSINIDYTKSVLLGQRNLDFANKILTESNTGIENIILKKIKANDFFGLDDEDLKNNYIDKLENLIDKSTSIDKKNALVFPYRNEFYSLFKEENDYFVFTVSTKHTNSDLAFDFNEESDGTNRLFELSPVFEELMNIDDIVYIIDELERSMHPLLAKELLRMYSLYSKSKSQLIFTTHESHLLDDDLLRRDEIWFTEKKSDGSTKFYPLSDFNPRGDKVLERGYLEGRYGGIPFLGYFSKLIKPVVVV